MIERFEHKDYLSRKNYWLAGYFLLTITLFMLRVIIFAGNYGGIETDDGWRLSVAKNLAHRGIYATYTNTLFEEKPGPQPSIHQRFSIQDEKGFCYFPAVIGPGYVLPQALLIRILGDGWWQYRLWPLVAYAGLLFLMFLIVWSTGGAVALVVFQIWLWATPQLTTVFAYMAFSEHIALFYLLLSFLLYSQGSKAKKRSLYYFLAGFFVALTMLTKVIYSLAVLAYLPVIAWEIYDAGGSIKGSWKRWLTFVSGLILPLFLFESYRYMVLVSQFGLEGWQASNENFRLTFTQGGSGVPTLGQFNWPFLIEKLRVWYNAGIESYWLAWLLFFISPLMIIPHIKKQQRVVVILMYGAAAITFIWFNFISPLGWARYAWQGIILGMMLICMSLGLTVQNRLTALKKENIVILLLLVIIAGVAIKSDRIEVKPFLDQQTIDRWRITRQGGRGLPHAAIIPVGDQEEVVDYFKKNIRSEDRIYYLSVFNVGEISTLADKVFYPLGRYFSNNQKNPDGGSSYVILGPYEQGPWSIIPGNMIEPAVNRYCERIVFANQFYSLCTLRNNVK
jgi:hypothetical protein